MEELQINLEELIADYPKEWGKLVGAQRKFVGHFMGKVMKKNNRLDPKKVKHILEEKFWEI
jgi:Asp-tRNA(Asn)/Glu-tRNA(Gln) amidotransferase B subunit